MEGKNNSGGGKSGENAKNVGNTENVQNNIKIAQNSKISKSEFSSSDLDFDIPENVTSISYLGFLLSEVEQKIEKIEGRTPREIRQLRTRINFRKNFLSSKMGEEIKPEEYFEMIKNEYTKSVRVSLFFSQEGENEKSARAKKKASVVAKEVKEMNEFLKGGGK